MILLLSFSLRNFRWTRLFRLSAHYPVINFEQNGFSTSVKTEREKKDDVETKTEIWNKIRKLTTKLNDFFNRNRFMSFAGRMTKRSDWKVTFCAIHFFGNINNPRLIRVLIDVLRSFSIEFDSMSTARIFFSFSFVFAIDSVSHFAWRLISMQHDLRTLATNWCFQFFLQNRLLQFCRIFFLVNWKGSIEED